MTPVIVADRMTGIAHLSVYLNAIYDAFMMVIFSRFAGVISRNRSSYGSTATRTDDRTFATTDFGTNRTTQGSAHTATNGRIERLVIAGASRETEQQAYREEQTLELHCRISVAQDNARVSQMSPPKTGNRSHGVREVIQESRRARGASPLVHQGNAAAPVDAFIGEGKLSRLALPDETEPVVVTATLAEVPVLRQLPANEPRGAIFQSELANAQSVIRMGRPHRQIVIGRIGVRGPERQSVVLFRCAKAGHKRGDHSNNDK